jgi:DNA polymerase III sliding clamp (beta) subunit (PCNA family)
VSAIQTERVVIEVGDGLKPAILRGQGEPAFTYLLMPVRLS